MDSGKAGNYGMVPRAEDGLASVFLPGLQDKHPDRQQVAT